MNRATRTGVLLVVGLAAVLVLAALTPQMGMPVSKLDEELPPSVTGEGVYPSVGLLLVLASMFCAAGLVVIVLKLTDKGGARK